MQTSFQLKSACLFFLSLFWSVAAFAAQATFVKDLSSIPPAALAISALLALIGGAAQTANRLADPRVEVRNVVAEIAKDMLTSVVVGLLIFCLGSYLQWPSIVQAGLITLGGYGGSRILDPAVETFIDWISRLGGERRYEVREVENEGPPLRPPSGPAKE